MDRVVTAIFSNPRTDKLVVRIVAVWLVALVARQVIGGI